MLLNHFYKSVLICYPLIGIFPIKKKKKLIGLFVISKTEDKSINIGGVKNLAI